MMDGEEVLRCFPTSTFVASYGSGVFSQGVESDKDLSRQIDLVVAVEDLEDFHRRNMASFPDHYPSALRLLGPSSVSSFHRTGGAHMLFFPFVRIGDRTFKYGVISQHDLLRDLTSWDTLYCAGRLQKPVKIWRCCADVRQALTLNLTSAVCASVILSSDTRNILKQCRLTELDLFRVITGLSYEGDIRMMIGEDQNKVMKIVQNNVTHFQTLYRPVVESMANKGMLHVGDDWSVVADEKQLSSLARALPGQFAGMDSKALKSNLSQLVRRVSFVQTTKGIISAGFSKSWAYAIRKLTKRFRG